MLLENYNAAVVCHVPPDFAGSDKWCVVMRTLQSKGNTGAKRHCR
jgi:hypothetical protein